MKLLRRTSLVLFVVLPPLFAWGCGPAPTWRRIVKGQTYACPFPDGKEVMLSTPPGDDERRICTVVDSRTGEARRVVELAAGAEPINVRSGGEILAENKSSGEMFLYGVDPEKPIRRFNRPAFANETMESRISANGRWSASTIRRNLPDEKPRLAVAFHDLNAGGDPTSVVEGLRFDLLSDDGGLALLAEEGPSDQAGITQNKPTRRVCVRPSSGENVWEATLTDEYRPYRFIAAQHWVVFERIGGSSADGRSKWVVLDDRNGNKVAEWGESVQTVSRSGRTVEVDFTGTRATVRGGGVVRTFDIGPSGAYRYFYFGPRSTEDETFRVYDEFRIFDPRSCGLQNVVSWKFVERLQNREWNLATGELTYSASRYRLRSDAYDWTGRLEGSDGSFEIQRCELFGVRWVQRVERPASKSVPFRVALGVGPGLAVWFLRRRIQRRTEVDRGVS